MANDSKEMIKWASFWILIDLYRTDKKCLVVYLK